MTDVVSTQARSRMMSGIRGKDTRPEMIVRKALFAAGYRFRLHRKDLPGKPDVVLPGRQIAIFIHGCFWHMHDQCKYAKLPATRPTFWQTKLSGNVTRDQKAIEALLSAGWRVLTVWECATRDTSQADILKNTLTGWIDGNQAVGSISGVKTG